MDLDITVVVMSLQRFVDIFTLSNDHRQVVIFIIGKCKYNKRFHGSILI